MIRILAKPKYGSSNLINDRLYAEVEKQPGIEVISWTPLRMLGCQYELLHVHWPENVLNESNWIRACLKVTSLMCALYWVRLCGRKLAWTAHNLEAHDGRFPKLEALFWRLFIPLIDGVIALSDESRCRLRRIRNLSAATKELVVPHGNYCGIYPDDISRSGARERLGIGADVMVLLNLGLVRRYKKIERLIELARTDTNLHVVVAGNAADPDYEGELRILADGFPNVHLDFKFIPDDELQTYFRAADCFVLPYDKITNSGSAILSLSYDLPILAPDLPCFETLKGEFGEFWVSTYKGDFSNETVESYLKGRVPRLNKRNVEWGDWEWSVIGGRVNAFYKTVLEK